MTNELKTKSLTELRKVAANKAWDKENWSEIGKVEPKKWRNNGDMFLRKFYYEASHGCGEPTESATFVVVFKKNSDSIKKTQYINTPFD